MKPILFNTEMVRAILGDRKTVTRRVVKPQPTNTVTKIATERYHKPYSPGQILYVRETWNRAPFRYDEFIYKADGCYGPDMPWQPSIHMPRDAARIFLRVTDVRVERLRDMGLDDFEAEGISTVSGLYHITDYFAEIWDRTIKRTDRALYGWEANPWVFVISFERISREEAEHG